MADTTSALHNHHNEQIPISAVVTFPKGKEQQDISKSGMIEEQQETSSSRNTSPISTIETSLDNSSIISASTTTANAIENEEEPYSFIQSPSKRKYFSNSLGKIPTDKMTLSYPEEENGNGSITLNQQKDVSFTPPQPVIAYTHGIQQRPSPKSLESQGHNDEKFSTKIGGPLDVKFVKSSEPEESPYQPTTTPIYTKTQYSSMEKFLGSSGLNAADPEKGQDGNPEYKLQYLPDDNIHEALMAFLFSTFNLIFSVGMAYWHMRDGLTDYAYYTLVILIIAGLVMKIAFLVNREIKVWRECKAIFLLCLIPFFTPFALSFADLIFTVKQSKNKSYVRPWTNTRTIYLVESLILAFPQCVYQSVLLVEDSESLPKLKGMITLVGLAILVQSMAFARVRYDSVNKPTRFGTGLDKILRTVIVASNKGLWVVTYICTIVTWRLHFTPLSFIFGVVLLLVILEVPIMISTIKFFERCVTRFTWTFFIIPQFVFLIALIYWVNADPGLYDTNVGVSLLGAASIFESVVLMGWLLDSCSDREMDVMPRYPHFLGDLWTWTCGKKRQFTGN